DAVAGRRAGEHAVERRHARGGEDGAAHQRDRDLLRGGLRNAAREQGRARLLERRGDTAAERRRRREGDDLHHGGRVLRDERDGLAVRQAVYQRLQVGVGAGEGEQLRRGGLDLLGCLGRGRQREKREYNEDECTHTPLPPAKLRGTFRA